MEMAHYSSQFLYYEDGNKPPLKSISVKLLVFASYAQFGVNAERVDNGRFIMAYKLSPLLWRPKLVSDLYVQTDGSFTT